VLQELEQRLAARLLIRTDPGLHHERFEILEVR
jgi:hypothetical protein